MTFSAFLTDFNLVVAGLGASFVAGVVLSTKVKDYLKGVPAQARKALSNIEAKALADINRARDEVIARLPGAGAIPAPKTPLPAAAPIAVAPVAVAPAAPAPAPAAPDPAAPQSA
jgi:hypothetical protein